MEKKYELTDETIEVNGKTLHRIRALRDFRNIEKGYLGGFIKKEDNLSHEGDCWVWHEAKVSDNAKVFGNAQIFENAKIANNARVYDNAKVCGNACVEYDAQIFGNTQIYGNAQIYGLVYGNARVYGNTFISDKGHISGDII
ncbi:MAG: hypothetical protein PV353_03615, partial [Bartonella sp.]|nr:hypothetical protein [Bartonella sp.]